MNIRTMALVASAALIVTACGGTAETSGVASLDATETTGSESTTPPQDDGTDPEEAAVAFTQCLRENGIEIDDPVIGPNGELGLAPVEIIVEVDGEPGDRGEPPPMPEGLEEAFAECEQHLQGVVFNPANAPDMGDIEDTFLEYAECMRDNGIDMPDPDFSNAGGVIEFGAIDPGDADFAAADEACGDILAGFGLPTG